jgi:hypothetical protein
MVETKLVHHSKGTVAALMPKINQKVLTIIIILDICKAILRSEFFLLSHEKGAN